MDIRDLIAKKVEARNAVLAKRNENATALAELRAKDLLDEAEQERVAAIRAENVELDKDLDERANEIRELQEE